MRRFFCCLLPLLIIATFARAAQTDVKKPDDILKSSLSRLTSIIEPAPDAAPRTFTTQLKLIRSDGLPNQFKGATLGIAFQAPDHLLLTAKANNETYQVARDGQQLWIYTPAKKFGVIGSPDIPRFSADPTSIDRTPLKPFSMPLSSDHLLPLMLMAALEALPAESINGEVCDIVKIVPREPLAEALGFKGSSFELAVRQSDSLPTRIRYNDPKHNVEIQIAGTKDDQSWTPDRWQLKSAPGDNIEKTAVSHITRFAKVAISTIGNKVPTLGPATGDKRVVAREGSGRLEIHDGTRVLIMKGTPEEMGRQHGILLKEQIRDCTDHILYGVGVGSSFGKGRWFFGEIEAAHKRLAPFISERYYREIDAMADAVGTNHQEARLANFFPELFHCSGFAIANDATVGGRLYHGRILDYMKGVGLEQNATVMVFQPEKGNAWVNIGYAGFIGSVTAMNAKHVAIGEMGGRGEGNWDGKPMAQLVREVMENADTLEEAVEIMRKSPRTCEYYYVISDGKGRKAVGIKAKPNVFETVAMGESHPELKRPVRDTVLVSAGDRYENLVNRVQQGYGKFTAESARALMDPPVCMNSNIHSVLFAPESLDFWVANADSQNVASKTRYTHYNLRELLDSGGNEGKNGTLGVLPSLP
ncbi:MAG TPA: C45 family autoproteolytic acyltransferase/hydrolase [Tepidisphaeraceae bacterium]|nr:C45 family autoproteolytic acyltransferase/hydrolase [Tepidisphaeraceae bacterium]